MPLIQFNDNLVIICICWWHWYSISMRIDGPRAWLVSAISANFAPGGPEPLVDCAQRKTELKWIVSVCALNRRRPVTIPRWNWRSSQVLDSQDGRRSSLPVQCAAEKNEINSIQLNWTIQLSWVFRLRRCVHVATKSRVALHHNGVALSVVRAARYTKKSAAKYACSAV